MAMRADEIVIVCLALLDVAICWAIYDLMDGKLTLILAGDASPHKRFGEHCDRSIS